MRSGIVSSGFFRWTALLLVAGLWWDSELVAQSGQGAKEDPVEAVRRYRSAAEAGDAGGMLNLGWMLANGSGVAQNDAEAVRWYRRAAEAGHPEAMDKLGSMHAAGLGTARDPEEAARWFRRSAEAGYSRGMVHLAVALQQGRGVARTMPSPCAGSARRQRPASPKP